MAAEKSLHGWAPSIGDETPLAEVIEAAFAYRVDVTVESSDRTKLVGYLYNRDVNRDIWPPEPFIQVFEQSGASVTIPYSQVSSISFTGKDTAAGKSYEAWSRRRAAKGSRRTTTR